MSLQAIFDPMVKAYFEKKYGGGGGNTGGGENPLDYAAAINSAFDGVDFGGGKDLVIAFGAKTATLYPNAFVNTFEGAKGVRSVKVIYEGTNARDIEFQYFARSPSGDVELETIDLTKTFDKVIPKGLNGAFHTRKGLKTILGEIDASLILGFTNTFYQNVALETVRFKAGSVKGYLSFAQSGNLTDETIQNIIDGLADLTGGTAQPLTLHPTVGAKLTDAQKAAASAKNWTISY
jgi:hypothetical protein